MKHPVLDTLRSLGSGVCLESYSALDRYFGVRDPGPVYVRTDADLVALARQFERLDFPSIHNVDAVLNDRGREFFFRCAEPSEALPDGAFSVQELLYDTDRDIFLDKNGVYPHLREPLLVPRQASPAGWQVVAEAAKLVARYKYSHQIDAAQVNAGSAPLSPASERDLLSHILQSRRADRGLEFLRSTGFIAKFWPEMAELYDVAQTKDYHPEGDVWEHTMEALRQRKDLGLTLGLGVLLHDLGKPSSHGDRNNPYQEHADIGARLARTFLRRLGYAEPVPSDVYFLVKNHMMPHMIPRMPVYRIRELMGSPLFPLLLEVYRSDRLSTFQSPDDYYEACRVYQAFLRHRANPHRRVDPGKRVLES